MAKIKIFAFKPENNEVISNFLQEVNVVSEGFFITDGHLGVMYKEKNEVGIDKSSFVTEVAKEVMKAQRKWINTEALIRAYTAVIAKCKETGEILKKEAEEIKQSLENHQANKDTFINPKTSARVAEITSRLGQINKDFKKASREDKDKFLKETQELETELAPLNAEMKTFAEQFDAETKRLQAISAEIGVKTVNNQGELKENTELLETAQKDSAHALLFVNTGTKLIADIEAGTLDKKTNLLTFSN